MYSLYTSGSGFYFIHDLGSTLLSYERSELDNKKGPGGQIMKVLELSYL
jgi:hypothetical protein